MGSPMTDFEDHDKTVISPGPGLTGESPSAAAATRGDPLPAGTRLGEFQITGLIGVGAFGNVYLAQDYSLGRTVALKEFMPQTLAIRQADGLSVGVRSARHGEAFSAGLISFINEARLLARFDHPSLVKVHRFWEANGTAYRVMPFYEGQTLTQALRAMGTPPTEQWLKDLLAPLLDVLQVIHAQDCFHLDIAPDNILLLKDGRPVLLDFGAARHVIGDARNPGGMLKPGFAPIEQYAKDATVRPGAWTDIYALAAVARYAILGEAPATSIERVIDDTMKPLEQAAKGRYGESFLRTLDRAFSLGPEKRPQTAQDMRGLWGLDAASAAAHGELADRAASQPTRESPIGMRTKALWTGLVVVCLAAGFGFVLLRDNAHRATALVPEPAASVAKPAPTASPAAEPAAPAQAAAPDAAMAASAAAAVVPAVPVVRAETSALAGAQGTASGVQESVQARSASAAVSAPRILPKSKPIVSKTPVKQALTHVESQSPTGTVPPQPAPVVQAAPVRVPEPAKPAAAGPSPVDICGRNRAFLSACVADRCKWAEFVNHPMCVELRANGK
jgi:hypothetical protein